MDLPGNGSIDHGIRLREIPPLLVCTGCELEITHRLLFDRRVIAGKYPQEVEAQGCQVSDPGLVRSSCKMSYVKYSERGISWPVGNE